MTKSYSWKDDTCDNVDWHPHGRALATLDYSKRVTITKFIHGWLPVNKHLNKIDPSAPCDCASCTAPEESQRHFLYCRSPNREAHRDFLQAKLTEWIPKRAPQPMADLLIKGLFEWSESNNADLPAELEDSYRHAAIDQQQIGWHQLWRGRLSSQWGDIFARHRIQQATENSTGTSGISAEEWTRQLIRHIWQGILEMWKIRNNKQRTNVNNDYTTTERLRNQISCIFIEAEELNLADQSPFNSTCVEVITARILPTRLLKKIPNSNIPVQSKAPRISELSSQRY